MLKRLLLCPLILFLFFFGCSSDPEISDYTIRVTGTKGVHFEGGIGSVPLVGDPETDTIKGVVPAEFTYSGSVVYGYFQKTAKEGKLKVEILKDGAVVAESETSLPHGSVSAGYNPSK